MLILADYSGRRVRLTDERLAHILTRSEMAGQEARISETLSTPDVVIVSRQDESVYLYHKRFADTPVSDKYLLVAVKMLSDDAFIITSFFTDALKKGGRIWPT